MAVMAGSHMLRPTPVSADMADGGAVVAIGGQRFFYSGVDDDALGAIIVMAGDAGDALGYRLCRARLSDALDRFGDAFGMTGAAKRSLVALYRHVDVRAAAASLGIGYETIREHLNSARTAVGAPTLARLLMLGIISAGLEARSGAETDQAFQRLFDLTERQVRLAALIANGSTRIEAAALLGVSEAVAKAELSLLFGATEANSSLALTRLMAETRVLVALSCDADFTEPYPAPASRSLMLDHPDGRKIGVSDYGPASGRPALVMHSSMTTRPVNRALVEALQDSGFRPISIDRPGFGDSDPLSGGEDGDYFTVAANDMAFVCATLQLGKVHVITRGAAQAATAFHREHGALIKRMVIINPDPAMQSSARTQGIIPTIKQNFLRRPWAISGMARVIARLSSYERIADNLTRMSAECPADAAAMAATANKVDYYRGVTAMREGKIAGFVAEQVGMATMASPAPTSGTTNISLLIGDHDFIHDPADTIAYWRAALPDARLIVVEGAGRFIAYSHAALAVAELGRA